MNAKKHNFPPETLLQSDHGAYQSTNDIFLSAYTAENSFPGICVVKSHKTYEKMHFYKLSTQILQNSTTFSPIFWSDRVPHQYIENID